MNFYSYEEIKSATDCLAVANYLALQLDSNGRCAATWRGGDGANVHIEADKWYDFKTKQGGGPIELVAAVKFSGDVQQAQNFLGEWLRLEPKMRKRPSPQKGNTRYDRLIEDGYREIKRYNYEAIDGTPVHHVVRLEHSMKEKQFLQGTPRGWGLGKTEPILYRMKDWHESPRVCIVEGEKDADTLIDEIGMPATTNSGGAEKFKLEYAEHFRGKDVAILHDNDDKGEKHGVQVARYLKDIAKTIALVRVSSLPKGDVTDWVREEGGTREKLIEAINSAPALNMDTLETVDPAVELAKSANRTELSNYSEHRETQKNGSIKIIRSARKINDIIKDVHTRFLGFPRRVGNSRFMFDHDRETGEIVHIQDSSELISWAGRKSDRPVAWTIGDRMTTKGEAYKGLHSEARAYEAISSVPGWPKRDDVYYSHPNLPPPSEGFRYFNTLVDFFSPADEDHKTLLKAFIAGPIWYEKSISRPGWIIDSQDGAGTGKTTLVELISMLYGSEPVRTNKQELKINIDRLIKRLLSEEGRHRRFLLADNVVDNFRSSELSDLMTSTAISGLAAYGRGEETRPNNLTFVITANSATVDNDLSDRCYFVHVCKPKRSANWKEKVLSYILKYRYNILADIIGKLEDHDPADFDGSVQTRFAEFEERILRGVCDNQQQYHDALNCLAESKASSNSEDESAITLEDEFYDRLRDAGLNPSFEQVFIRSDVVKLWIAEIGEYSPQSGLQFIRNLAKNGLTKRFDAKPERFPHRGKERRRGIMWVPESKMSERTEVIGLKGRKVTRVMTVLGDSE